MKIKSRFIVILFIVFLPGYCNAQYNGTDSIKKLLYGDWQLLAHHKGARLFFDTTKHTLTIKTVTDSILVYTYSIEGDSLFTFGKDQVERARIKFEHDDRFYLYFREPLPYMSVYIRKKIPQ